MSVAGAPATMRLFVACDIPDATTREIAAWQQRAFAHDPGVRVNHALHVTLAFLGSVSSSRVDHIADALSAILLTLNPLLGVIVLAGAPLIAFVYRKMSDGAQRRRLVFASRTSWLRLRVCA